MIKFGKKASVLILAVVVMVMSLAGCSQFTSKKLDEKAIAMTIGNTNVSAGMVNFYARYWQAQYEAMYSQYTTNPWLQFDEDTVKKDVLDGLKELYVVNLYAAEQNVSLTDEELKAIDAAADKFEKANSEDAKNRASAKKEYMLEYLKMYTLSQKLNDALEAKYLKEAGTDSKDTDAAKKIAEEKASEEYAKLIDGWLKKTTVKEHKKVLDKISFKSFQVLPIYEQTSTDDTKQDTTTDKETTDKETTDKETTDKESTDKESTDQESADNKTTETEQ